MDKSKPRGVEGQATFCSGRRFTLITEAKIERNYMEVMIKRLAALGSVLMLVFVLNAQGVGSARADSTNWVYDANCNNWHPHAWSNLSYSGGPSNANAFSHADLYQWNYGTSKYDYVHTPNDAAWSGFGSSGTSNADGYESSGEYGTGVWQAIEDYTYWYGTNDNIAGGNHYDYPDCGS